LGCSRFEKHLIRPEAGECPVAEGDASHLVRLRVLLDEHSAPVDDGTTEQERGADEVHVRPTQRAEFATPRPGEGSEPREHREIGVVLLDGLEE
jgi:hypothetical protein